MITVPLLPVFMSTFILRIAAFNSYQAQTYFRPKDIGITMLPDAQTKFIEIEPGGFNPSIAFLPQVTRRKIDTILAESGVIAKATYLMSFRKSGSSCKWLTNRRLQYSRAPISFGRSKLALVDENLTTVLPIMSLFDPTIEFSFPGEDLRLHANFYNASSILTSSMLYFRNRTSRWQMLSLDLNVNFRQQKVLARTSTVDHPDIKGEDSFLNGKAGRNFGILINDQSLRGPLYIQASHAEYMPLFRGIPFVPLSKEPSIIHQQKKKILGMQNRSLHNNGNPLKIYTEFPGLYLSIGHIHIDKVVPAYHKEKGSTPNGNTYINYFIFYQDTYPFKKCRLSPPFCLPDNRDLAKCHVIQFITGYLYLEHTKEILITFGVNDCESAYSLVSVEAVRNFAFGSTSTTCEN